MTLQDTTPEGAAKVSNLPKNLWCGRFPAGRFGRLTMIWAEEALVELAFDGDPRRSLPVLREPKKAKVPQWLADPFGAYFSGDRTALGGVPVKLFGTEFQLRVWGSLRKIPPGTVKSYGAIAAALGKPRAMRAVGMANRANPIPLVVPCHRVIQAGHRLGGYRGGLERKRFLLRLEGVTLDGDLVRPGQLALPKSGRKARKSSPGRGPRNPLRR